MMSTAAPLLAEPPLAPSAGEDLRIARERLGWTIEAVARELRIRTTYLQALETGQIKGLPGHAYALGFLRTYAAALGLDPEEMIRRFKAEAGEVSRKTELAFPAPMPERGLPTGAVMLLGLLLAVGVYIGWYRLSGEGKLPPETVAPVPAHLAPLAEQAVPPTPATASRPALATATSLPTDADGQAGAPGLSGTSRPMTAMSGPFAATTGPGQSSVATEPAPPVPSISPSSAAAAGISSLPMLDGSAQAAPVTTAMPVAPATAAADADGSRIVIRAKADAWIRVKDRSGSIVFDRVLHPGDSYNVPNRPNLLLSMGNAGGTELVVDGATTPLLGGSGVVLKDLPLDPELIKDGKLLAARTVSSAAPSPLTRPQ